MMKLTVRLMMIPIVAITILSLTGIAFAEGITPELQKKITEYKAKLKQWGANAEVVNAVEAANKKSLAIDNTAWKALKKDDPKVMSFTSSKVGKMLAGWQGKGLGKLFVRDSKGNLVAGSKKPAKFNISEFPAYQITMKGKSWNSKKVKPDVTTKQESIVVAVPIVKNGKTIGMIHAAVIK